MSVYAGPEIVNNGLVLALDAGNLKSFNPNIDTYSNYFDGTGDFLSLASNSAFAFGTGNFTVEFWFNPSNATGVQGLFGIGNDSGTLGNTIQIFWRNSRVDLSVYGDLGAGGTASTIISTNVWTHIALVREGTGSNQTKIYVNGVSSSFTTATNFVANRVSIGRPYYNLNQEHFTGYISNLRVVKGTAVYTSNFTPPTTPLSAITNTSLLTCQSATLIDNSTNNFTITKNGDVSVQTLIPFTVTTWTDVSGNGYNGTLTNGPTYSANNGGSIVFDGSNDYASLPSNFFIHSDSNPFSISLWFRSSQTTGGTLFAQQNTTNPDSASGYVPVIYLRSDGKIRFEPFWTGGVSNFILSNSALNDNIWHNLVATFSSGTAKLYIDGTFQSQITTISQIGYSSTYYYLVGAGYASAGGRGLGTNYFTGNISNFKFYTKELVLAELQQNFNALRGRFGI